MASSTQSRAEKLQWLTNAIAGAALPIVRIPIGTAWANGEALHLPAAANHENLIAAAHALWLAAGTFANVPRGLASAATMPRYLALELRRALHDYRYCLPSQLEAELTHYVIQNSRPKNSAQSLQWARDNARPVVTLPAFFGTLKFQRNRAGTSAIPAAITLKAAAHNLAQRERAAPRRDRFLQWFTNPLASSNWMSELVLKLLGFEHAASGKAGNQGGSSALAATGDIASADDSLMQRVAARLHKASGAQFFNAQWHYPEWSESVGRYRLNWVHVHEVTPHEHNLEIDDQATTRALLRQLAAEGLRMRHRRHQPSGDEPEIDALIDRVIARRAGQESLPRYTALQRNWRDLSVLILVDASGSTGDRNASGGALIGEHRWAALQLAKAFTQLGDAVAVYGFHSSGRHALRMLRIKRFDEQLALNTRQRLAALKPAGFTRLGGAIRHATAVLQQQLHVEHRLLILLSDGLPYDTEYSGRYAEADTARALAEAADDNIACLCIAFGGDCDDAQLRQVYGETAYVKLKHREQLYTRLRPLLRSAFQ